MKLPRVIAEAGQCGEGDLDRFVSMATEAAAAGCWGFKVQLLRPETIATPDAAIYWDDRRGQTNQRQTFTEAGLVPYDAWGPVIAACNRWDIEFLATPFDVDAVDALADYGCGYVKIASGDITNLPLLEAIERTDMRPILSTGAAQLYEIIEALDVLDNRAATVLLACSLQYPTPQGHANLGRIATLTERFPGHEVGYSDHTVEVDTAGLAVAAGATWLEKHYTWRVGSAGGTVPDHDMALNPERMAAYVRSADRAHLALGSGNLGPHAGEMPAHDGARRSLYFARDMEGGEHIAAEDVIALRPLRRYAVEPSRLALVVGGRVMRSVKAGDPVRMSVVGRVG